MKNVFTATGLSAAPDPQKSRICRIRICQCTDSSGRKDSGSAGKTSAARKKRVPIDYPKGSHFEKGAGWITISARPQLLALESLLIFLYVIFF